ncbi:hypothetical protein ACWYXK_26615 [Janthinobacterium lividum]
MLDEEYDHKKLNSKVNCSGGTPTAAVFRQRAVDTSKAFFFKVSAYER